MMTSFRQSRVVMFALAMAFVFSGCAGNGTTNPAPAPATIGSATQNPEPSPHAGEEQSVAGGGRKIKVGFSMDSFQEERWLKDRDLFKIAVEELGADVIIESANGDDAKQILQAETMISQGIDILVLIPHNAESVGAIVKKAHSAGIKVIAYDRLIKNADIDLYVSFDNEKVGELQAKAITGLVPKGKYVYIGGADTDNNAHLIKKGVYRVLQPLIDKGDITIVYDQWTKDWAPANAIANMEEALKANGDKIDAVISANDATAGGAIHVLEAHGLAGKLPVAGQDADLAGAQRIVVGSQTMTVYKPIKLLAEKAAELAVKLAKGENVDADRKVNNGKIEVPSVLLPPVAVDYSNIDKTIIADGFHSREDVYKNAKK
ncbi:D-xylose ABC transporter substrate-binding protein [Cohnella suwonensis]|uniref:D-xylose ABC transporter substrate-binding protein n=1 Tax=Cohnella suwonensis TaxID=696072 RepID=A0ABW0LVR3_9BACL